MATSAQQVELYAFTWAFTLVKGKTANILLTVDMLLEQLMVLECCENNMASLLPTEIKF